MHKFQTSSKLTVASKPYHDGEEEMEIDIRPFEEDRVVFYIRNDKGEEMEIHFTRSEALKIAEFIGENIDEE